MRIGIDARELCGHPTGVGRYLSGLLAAWADDDRANRHEFVLYAPRQLATPMDVRRFPVRVVPGSGGTWWEQISLPAAAARDNLNVLFAPAYTTALAHRMPTVVALHDLSFVAHPEWFTRREGARRRWLARRSAASACAVVTISEFSRREILDRFKIASERIHVIPPGIEAPARVKPPDNPGDLRSRVNAIADGPRELRVLYVGSVFNRRHLPDLIRGFATVARAHPSAVLELVGDNRTYPYQDLEQIIAAEAPGRVRWRPYVTDVELATLFASARAFAFLSEYEGLGLTPLEALAAGVPPVLLDTPVARESCGSAALYVAQGDVAAITVALTELLFDDQRRATLLREAPSALARYRWPRAARETLNLLEQCGSSVNER